MVVDAARAEPGTLCPRRWGDRLARRGQTDSVTTAAALLCVAAASSGLANWWSRVRDDERLERWSKPLTLVALTGVALTIDPAQPDVRAWFVVALLFCLAGDVLLLDDRRFVFGLGAFLLGHVAYGIGFVVAETWRWWAFVVAGAALAGFGATVGVRIIRGARAESAALGGPVIAYLVVISAMAAAAAAGGNWWAIAGAGLFVGSDAVLGWRRFVHDEPWMSPTVMITYHLGQAGLVLSLL